MSEQESWCQPNKEDPRSKEDQLVSIPALCEMGWQPLLITGFLRDKLVEHFAEPLGIKSPDLRKYVWTPDERTGILIDSVHRWRGELVEKRPAILLKRNPYQSVRLGIGDLSGITGDGHTEHTVLWVGSHTVFCLHGTGASTEILTTEVQKELTQFAPAVTGYLGLKKFSVTHVGAISEVEEATENYFTPITVAWAYEENWVLEYQSLPIRRIPLSVLVDWQSLDG